MSAERRDAFDPLVSTGKELEIVRRQLAEEAEQRQIEFERFREETLWRLNALSDRTIELARSEEDGVTACLAEDLTRIEARIVDWEKSFLERLHDERFLNGLAAEALERLLPIREGGGDL